MEVRTVIIFRTLLCKVWRSGRWIGKSDFWNEFGYPGGVSPDRSWAWTSQTEMPCPGVVLLKSNTIQKRLEKPPTFHSRNPKAPGEMHFVLVRLFPQSPWHPSPSADSCWSQILGCALLTSRFHLYPSFPHVPAQNYATWPKYSNRSAPCQATHLREWSQPGLLFGLNLSLFYNKIICLSSTPLFYHL